METLIRAYIIIETKKTIQRISMKINLLIVDDIKENLYALEVLLEELKIEDEHFEGLNIISTLNGEEALRIALKENIDLILLDVRMPIIDGFEVAEILKSSIKTSHIPIIFLTAEFKSDDFINRGYKVGALDYFTKPIEKFQFLNKIQLYITLFLSKKVQKKEFDDTLGEYMNLIDEHIISSDTDTLGNITRVSQAFCNISGYSKEELVGNSHSLIRSADTTNKFYEKMWNTLVDNKTWKGQIKNRSKNDTFYWIDTIISPTYNKDGKKIGYTSIKQDITDKKKLEEISVTDALTEIFNRRFFDETMPKIINSAKRHNKLICFAMADIDFFKGYNDTYGHQAGDDVLKKVANVFKSSTHRADDYCFRIGGEEFGIAFSAPSKEKALLFMSRIQESIEALQIENVASNISRYLTVSMGLVCEVGKAIMNLDSLYEDTDKLLYEAKRSGRNQIVANFINTNEMKN